MDTYLAMLNIGKKPDEDTVAGKPKTNFSLVDLDENKKAASSPAAASTAGLLGFQSVASAAPVKLAAGVPGTAKTPVAAKESVDTAKVYGKLAKLYGAMKPEEAVAVFNNLEDEQVVMILYRMDDETAAKVLAVMEPKRAARLTQAMIKRK